jgi:DNA-binding transcriptional MerR regulator
MTGDPKLLSIGELAERTGVSRRTVRFYVQKGLIAPPEGRGRGSGYTEAHVEQVLRVRQLQREGLVLDTIRQLDEPEAARPAKTSALPAVTVCRITLADGVRLELDSQRIPPDPRVLAALAEACNRILNLKGKEEDDDENP